MSSATSLETIRRLITHASEDVSFYDLVITDPAEALAQTHDGEHLPPITSVRWSNDGTASLEARFSSADAISFPLARPSEFDVDASLEVCVAGSSIGNELWTQHTPHSCSSERTCCA